MLLPGLLKKIIAGATVEFNHLKKDLFWGFELKGGKYIAEREKALFDQLYMVSLGKRSINIEELDLREIDKVKLENYAKKFPAQINPLFDQVKKYSSE